MKKLIIFFFSILLISSCKKDNNRIHQEVTGVLTFWDPATDGLGFYYDTDNGERLIIKYDYANDLSPYLDPKYAGYLNVHTRLTFTYRGETGYLFTMIANYSGPKLPVVEVESLEKL